MPNRFVVRNLTKSTVVAKNLEVATSSAARRKGLLGKTGPQFGEGLWIVPCEAIHTFGMQTSIDAVFIDRNKRVRKLRSNLKPNRIAICITAHSIIELPAGRAAQSNTEPGDQLEITRISE
jgi:uncharacterized membrane protein (UPF0127 family)